MVSNSAVKVKVPDEVLASLDAYSTGLEPQQHRAEIEATKSTQMLAELKKGVVIKTQEEFQGYATLLRDVKGTIKFLDEERKVSVGPLNIEVKRINTWFKPAIDGGEAVVAIIERLMSNYLIAKKKEEQALLKKAEEEAKRALALAAPVATLSTELPTSAVAASPAVQEAKALMKDAAALVQQASGVMPEKVEGVSDRASWKIEVTNANALERRFLMPDMSAIKAWVQEHGDKDVPAGVKVEAEFKFTVRSAK